MPLDILMPALSPTMTEGKLANWLVQPGDEVTSGQVLAEIETDKATMEVEAVDEGKIAKLLIDAGTEGVAVNTPIAVLLEEDEDDNALENYQSSQVHSQGLEPQENITADAGSNPSPSASAAQIAGEDLDPIQRDIAYAKGQLVKPPVFDESQFTETTEITVRQALCDAMAEEMRRDDDVFIMGEEVAEYNGAYKVTQGLLDEFGDRRVIDTPITEHGFAGLACGAAFEGLKPVVEFMTMNFAMQAIDHIINSAAKTLYMAGGQMGCPIVFRGPNGAASRVAAQHSQCYASWYAHVPGLKVVAPYSAADAKGLMKAAIRDPNPVVILENEIMYGQSFECPTSKDYVIPFGRAKIEREGTDVTIVTFSIMVGKALEAAAELEKDGISAEVINLLSLRPIDSYTIIESLKKTHRMVTVEEGFPYAGIGSEIAAIINEFAFDELDAPLQRVCQEDVPLPYAANLEKLALPQTEDIVSAVKRIV